MRLLAFLAAILAAAWLTRRREPVPTVTPERCGILVPLYEVAYGDLYDPCMRPKGHAGSHDPFDPADAIQGDTGLVARAEGRP